MPKKLHNSFIKTFDRIFLSVPLAIGLILAICVACLVGITTSFTQIFSDKWFLAGLSFVGFMMLYCSTRRFPRIISLYLNGPSNIEHDLFNARNFFSGVIANDSKINGLDVLSKTFHKHGYKRNTKQRQAEGTFLYEKARLGILGPHILHLGIAILLVAGIVTAWGGKFYDVNIKEGESIKLDGTDTHLTLEKFEIIPSMEKEMADEYASRLRINRVDRPIEWRILKVNAPLRVGKFRFYQMRYSFDVEQLDIAIFDHANDALLKIIPLTIGQRVTIPEFNVDIEVGNFIPDFAIDKSGNVSARSSSVKNPAAFISVFSPSSSDQIAYQGRIFRNFISPHPDGGSKSFKWKFSIDRIRVRNISGIKVTKNPGEFLSYVGLILLILGSILSCYKFYQCIVVKIEETDQDGDMNIQCFALRTKNMFEFEKKLTKIKKELQDKF